MIKVIYCYSNGKVGQEGLPYICIFRNRVNGEFFLGIAATVWVGSKYQWQSFDDVPSYPYAYLEIDTAAITSPDFIAAVAKDFEISFKAQSPSVPEQFDLFK